MPLLCAVTTPYISLPLTSVMSLHFSMGLFHSVLLLTRLQAWEDVGVMSAFDDHCLTSTKLRTWHIKYIQCIVNECVTIGVCVCVCVCLCIHGCVFIKRN